MRRSARITFGCLALIALPAIVQAQVCAICFISTDGGSTVHWWVEGSETLCEGEDEQSLNDCDERTLIEHALHPWGEEIEGPCGPNCGEGASEEQEELLKLAVTEGDWAWVGVMVRAHAWLEFNRTRSAVQALGCNESVFLHLPVSKVGAQELAKDGVPLAAVPLRLELRRSMEFVVETHGS